MGGLMAAALLAVVLVVVTLRDGIVDVLRALADRIRGNRGGV